MKRAYMAGNFQSQYDKCAFRTASCTDNGIKSADVPMASALCVVNNVLLLPLSVCPVVVDLWGADTVRR